MFRLSLIGLLFSLICTSFAQTQRIDLTLPYAIDLAFTQGYAAQNATAQYQSTARSLEAEMRRLRTSVSLNIQLPNYSESLTNQFNPSSAQYEYYQIQTAQVQGGLVVNQPLPFLGGTLILQEQLIGRGQTSGLSSAATFRRDYFNNLTVQYRQPLFTPNTYRITEERNRISSDQARADFVKSQMDVEYSVTEAFYSLHQLQRRYEIIQEQVQQNQESYETARTKFSSGLIPEVDYLQSDVDLISSRNDLLTVERDVARARSQFRLLIGLTPTRDFVLVASPTYRPISIDPTIAVAKALGGRAEMLRARRTIDTRLIDIQTTEARGDFRADLTASYGMNAATQNADRLFTDYGLTRGGTLTLSIPLFDWGSNSLDIQSARILHTNAIHSFENTEQQIRLEISDLVSRIQLAESRIQLLEKVVAVAEKGYAISLERFKTGTASRNDLAQSQQRLTNAKLNNLNALIDYQIAIADLRRRTLWDFEQKEPINPKWYPESSR